MKYWKEDGLSIGIKDEEELKFMRESGRILGEILATLEKMIEPGISGLDLDAKAAEMMKKYQVEPSFKGYQGFPNVICSNINDQVVHGIPTDRKLNEGDIITIDCGVIVEGFHSDSAITRGVGQISPELQKLIKTGEKALEKGINKAGPNVRVGQISAVIEDTVIKEGYSIVHELVGHGIGQKLHEDPPVPNHREKSLGPMLQPGMTIAIEPIICMGNSRLKLLRDGWTYVTEDGSMAVQAEHTIAITQKGAEILTKRPSSTP